MSDDNAPVNQVAVDVLTLRNAVAVMPAARCSDPECITCKRQVAKRQAATDALGRLVEVLLTKGAL